MTMRPPQPPQSPRPLDAEERALAKALPRLHGRTAPGPDLDASILAAAQAAVHPAKPARAKPARAKPRPRARWIAPASLAASMVLAVGIAWQLRPLPTPDPGQPATQSDSADMAAVQMIEPASSEEPAPILQPKPVPMQSASAERQRADPPVVASPPEAPVLEARALQSPAPLPVPPPPPPQVSAPPAPPAPAIAAGAPPNAGASVRSSTASSGHTLEARTTDTQVVDRAMRARPAMPVTANKAVNDALEQEAAVTTGEKTEMLKRTQQSAPKVAAPAPVTPAMRKEAREAADAGFVDDPEQDVPPATVDSPAVRDAWLQRIAELLDQDKQDEAKASLTEFRRRYPAVVLPTKLRTLEIEH